MSDDLERYQPQPRPLQPYGSPPQYGPQPRYGQQHEQFQYPPGQQYYAREPYGYQDYGYQQHQPPVPVAQPYVYGPLVGRPVPTASPKSPGVALILSLLIPGLGQLYTSNPVAAVLWFVGAVAAYVLIGLLIGVVLVPLIYLGAMIHAYVCAGDWNRRHHAVL